MQKEYIGNNDYTYKILNNVKSKLFICTTPQLNIMQLKEVKSK